MELHAENAFKIRSYSSAYNTIRRLPMEVLQLNREQLLEIGGIGKNIADKIIELKETGTIAALERYLDQTPSGIVEMLSIKGLGAKKILAVWKELGIESPGELLYACEENRLVELKGFGEKTQKTLHGQLVYFFDAQGKYLYGHVLHEGLELLDILKDEFSGARFSFINDMQRQMQIVHSIDIIGTADTEEIYEIFNELGDMEYDEDQYIFKGSKINYEEVIDDEFDDVLFDCSCSEDFASAWNQAAKMKAFGATEEEKFAQNNFTFIPAEARERKDALDISNQAGFELIELNHIKGVVHNHSTYSDGVNSVAEMAQACIEKGYEYLVMSDHSQSAFYANGLKPDDVFRQMNEIDELNKSFDTFKVYKGIESDILYDGQLDYEDEVLELFDVVIASVHSNLKMDVVKATDRVINAVLNPYTKILGHPTGRLLLSRAGYPIDHMAVIDACAENDVAIELNANPYRLDLDWTWIPYAVEKGVLVAINPDAHSIKGIDDIQFGVSAARKALLQPKECLNVMNISEFEKWMG